MENEGRDAMEEEGRGAMEDEGRGAVEGGDVAAPDPTAVRVALWRALHVRADPAPHVLVDEVGLRLADPGPDRFARPDMDPERTRTPRASIVARARYVEDLVAAEAERGIGQYVVLGAGLDTFVQRRPEVAARLRVFEVDRPGPQTWKRRRLEELGYGVPEGLRFVPVDFEAGDSGWDRLADAGFDADRPAVVASTGVSMYLTRRAVTDTLRRVAALAPGSTLVMSFLVPSALLPPREREQQRAIQAAARASGTPFLSFFEPREMTGLARAAGFRQARHVSADDLARRFFTGRPDGLRPSGAERLQVASV
jgi:methyltransferase (TIGR00027 family)